ncbi:MAG: DUF5684 domain-containing protein [Pseudobutyrivibrio sp.]|nr:DUF5684 domain-containing protein [Pseudobutyrivibrio sp.]
MYLLSGEYSFTSVIFVLVFLALMAVGRWKVFTKMGEKGWKGIIPFYSGYLMYKRTWDTIFFWMYLVLNVVGSLLSRVVRMGFMPLAVGQIVSYLSSMLVVLGLIVNVVMLRNLARAFGKGWGFTIGLVLLNPIFIFILGMSESQYTGNIYDEIRKNRKTVNKK